MCLQVEMLQVRLALTGRPPVAVAVIHRHEAALKNVQHLVPTWEIFNGSSHE